MADEESEKDPGFLRQITKATEDEDGKGWEVELDCGHVTWCAVLHPVKTLYCGQCLHQYVEQQKRRKEHGGA